MTFDELRQAADFLRSTASPPTVTLLLGSGYGGLLDLLEDRTDIPYQSIPHFPRWGAGESGATLIIGTCAGKRIAAVTKRFQYCLGHTTEEIAFPLRVLKLWGSGVLVITNAAGGINTSYTVGDFVAIIDHIDLTARNPLIGVNLEELGPRFPDMSEIYDRGLVNLCLKVANEIGIPVKTGVYLGVTGPSYETPAEIRAFRMLGADLVGMSTVPEAIIGKHMGQRIFGISTVTNQAAGNTPLILAHEDVLKVSGRKAREALRLIREMLARM